MGWPLLGPCIILAAVAAFVLLERRFPYDRQPLLRAGFADDFFFYAIAQSWVLALVIGWIIRAADEGTGLSRLRLVGGWPVWAQLGFFVVSHDLYIYWFHRWQHASPTLWRLHEAHHSATAVDWLTSTRSHALEILVNQTVEFAPMILLGAAPQVPLVKSVIGAVWGMYIHANLGVRMGWFQLVLNGPEAHRWHHALDPDAQGRNYATKLALWDRLFGTAYLPKARRPSGYGLGDVPFPRGYLAQQLIAFRGLWSRVKPGSEVRASPA